MLIVQYTKHYYRYSDLCIYIVTWYHITTYYSILWYVILINIECLYNSRINLINLLIKKYKPTLILIRQLY